MKVKDFKKELQKSYAKYFNGSRIEIDSFHGFYKSIVIKCYLINNIDEAINKIAMNDMFRIAFHIKHNEHEFEKENYNLKDEMILPDDLSLEKWSNSYTIKPQSKYLAYSSKDVSFRKTKGNAQKIIATLDKFFSKLSLQLHDDIKNDLIHKHHIDLLKLRLK